jgi:hypothetical protein
MNGRKSVVFFGRKCKQLPRRGHKPWPKTVRTKGNSAISETGKPKPAKIPYYEAWERSIAEGVTLGQHEPSDPPLSDNEREQLKHLIELRDCIRAGMIEAGRIEA